MWTDIRRSYFSFIYFLWSWNRNKKVHIYQLFTFSSVLRLWVSFFLCVKNKKWMTYVNFQSELSGEKIKWVRRSIMTWLPHWIVEFTAWCCAHYLFFCYFVCFEIGNHSFFALTNKARSYVRNWVSWVIFLWCELFINVKFHINRLKNSHDLAYIECE